MDGPQGRCRRRTRPPGRTSFRTLKFESCEERRLLHAAAPELDLTAETALTAPVEAAMTVSAEAELTAPVEVELTKPIEVEAEPVENEPVEAEPAAYIEAQPVASEEAESPAPVEGDLESPVETERTAPEETGLPDAVEAARLPLVATELAAPVEVEQTAPIEVEVEPNAPVKIEVAAPVEIGVAEETPAGADAGDEAAPPTLRNSAPAEVAPASANEEIAVAEEVAKTVVDSILAEPRQEPPEAPPPAGDPPAAAPPLAGLPPLVEATIRAKLELQGIAAETDLAGKVVPRTSQKEVTPTDKPPEGAPPASPSEQAQSPSASQDAPPASSELPATDIFERLKDLFEDVEAPGVILDFDGDAIVANPFDDEEAEGEAPPPSPAPVETPPANAPRPVETSASKSKAPPVPSPLPVSLPIAETPAPSSHPHVPDPATAAATADFVSSLINQTTPSAETYIVETTHFAIPATEQVPTSAGDAKITDVVVGSITPSGRANAGPTMAFVATREVGPSGTQVKLEVIDLNRLTLSTPIVAPPPALDATALPYEGDVEPASVARQDAGEALARSEESPAPVQAHDLSPVAGIRSAPRSHVTPLEEAAPQGVDDAPAPEASSEEQPVLAAAQRSVSGADETATGGRMGAVTLAEGAAGQSLVVLAQDAAAAALDSMAAELAALDRAVQELMEELESIGDQWSELLTGAGVSPTVAATLASATAAGLLERRRRRRPPTLPQDDDEWLWLYADLLGVAPGTQR